MSLTRNMGIGTKIVPPKNITNVIVKILEISIQELYDYQN